MDNMDVLKRFPIKYVRDYIKKDYKISDKCVICESKENLELHHLYSLSQLWQKWCLDNNFKQVRLSYTTNFKGILFDIVSILMSMLNIYLASHRFYYTLL